MNGIEKKQLQIDRGTRELVENIDDLRCKFGFSAVKVQTPIVETRLRSGLFALRPLIFTYDLPKMGSRIQVTVPLTFPKQGQLSFLFLDEKGEEDPRFISLKESLLDSFQSVSSLSSALVLILENLSVSNATTNVSDYQNEEGATFSSDLSVLDEEAIDLNSIKFFTCRTCRYCLADSLQLNEHSRASSCTSLFLEESPNFLRIADGEDEGKLLCPRCESKVGSWSWVGSKCSCGAWIVPAYQIVKSKVDMKSYAE